MDCLNQSYNKQFKRANTILFFFFREIIHPADFVNAGVYWIYAPLTNRKDSAETSNNSKIFTVTQPIDPVFVRVINGHVRLSLESPAALPGGTLPTQFPTNCNVFGARPFIDCRIIDCACRFIRQIETLMHLGRRNSVRAN